MKYFYAAMTGFCLIILVVAWFLGKVEDGIIIPILVGAGGAGGFGGYKATRKDKPTVTTSGDTK